MKWVSPPFDRCLAYVQESDRLLSLCMQGLQNLTTIPRLLEAVAPFDSNLDKASAAEVFQQRLDDTKKRAAFALAEIESGFPALHAHAVVAQWGALDALVSDLVVAWLLNDSQALRSERVGRIKLPLAVYESLDREGRMSLLAQEINRSINADLKLGIGKFESLLEVIGLAGAVDDATRRDLLEVSEVRNLLVHRAGVADRRFVETCPWLKAEIGTELRVSHADYGRYCGAMQAYILCLINRARVHFGIPPYSGDESCARYE